MSGKPAARLGDPTVCPVPGHGDSPIAAGSPDVLFEGLAAARQGDASSCGGALSGNVIPTVLINGKPAAVVGSVGSHGNVVTAGSGSIVIGDSPVPAAFVAPNLLNSANPMLAASTSPASPRSPRSPTTPQARRWHEEVDDYAPLGLEEEDEEEELDDQPQHRTRQVVSLRIGVFFDGTGNNMANAAVTEQCRREDLRLLDERTLQEVAEYCEVHDFSGSAEHNYFTQAPDDSYGNAPSNVARLYSLYRDDTLKRLGPSETTAAIAVYLEGIGTTSGAADSIIDQITGGGDTGIRARVSECPSIIRERLELFRNSNPELNIECIEFDIFGFSRGAAAARHFANELLKPNGGVLTNILQAGQFGLVDRFDWSAHAHINFVGLFDTVAAVINPLDGDLSPADHYNGGINLYLPPGCARKVVQLTARDEKRWNFALNSVAPAHQEIVLPGVHSDIGGGYRPLMLERLVLSRPVRSIVSAGTPLEQTLAWRETWRQYREWDALGAAGEGSLEARIRPTLWRAMRERGIRYPTDKQVLGMLLIERHVRGELALVYLRIMRELAVQYGVPFGFIDAQEHATAIPSDLRNVAEKLMSYAQGSRFRLDEEDERLLRTRYIHLSAHWTPSKGVMVNKPTPNVRLIYNNKPQQGYPE